MTDNNSDINKIENEDNQKIDIKPKQDKEGEKEKVQEKQEEIKDNNNNNNKVALTFKKPIKNRNLRKITKANDSNNNNNNNENENTENENNDGDEKVDLKDLLELTKEKQKLREKGKGVNVGVLAEGPHVKQTFRELENKLDDSFTVHQDKQEVNIYLEKYVNEQLELKKLNQKQQQQEKQKQNNENENQDKKENDETATTNNNIDLFETPEHLKSQKNKTEEKTNWVAGIAEVQLPDVYKYKNIVETERAKEELDKKPKNYEKVTPQNYNQNYQFHNRYSNNKKQRNDDKATDQETMENFKKRFRY